MADKKISALTSATTPLAGTEVLPIVQSSATVKVAVSDLTAGRAISATQLTLTTGNLIVASGQGIDFSATSGTGTSELLADYEEGTWTTTVSSLSNWNATPTLSAAIYTKVGRMVTIEGKITGTTTILGATALFFTIPFSTADVSSGATGSAFEQGGYDPGNVSDPTSGSSNVMLLTTGVLAGGVSRIVNFSITYCAA